MKYLLLLILTMPLQAQTKVPAKTQVELLTEMVESQQKMIQTLIDAVQMQDAKISELSVRLGALEKGKPTKLDDTPKTHGCYAWLSDGGREAIPCPASAK